MGNLTEVTADFLARSGEIFGPAVARAQASGSLRPDREPPDVPYVFAMVITVLGTVELEKAARRRYLSFLLDALNPAQATLLPPM